MGSQKPEQLLERAKKAEGMRDMNRALFEDCYEYLLPFRNTFSMTPGQLNKPSKVFDSTGMIAASNFVNTMQSNFTPVFQRWAEFKPGPGVDEESKEDTTEALSELTKMVFTYLNASNFALASAEMYFDWGIGTGALWVFEGNETQPLNFVSMPISQYALEEGAFGEVAGIFKETELAGELIEPTFKNFRPKLPQSIKDKIAQDPKCKIKLTECLYKDYTDFVWRYEVIINETKDVIVKTQVKEAICLTPRWLKIPGFPYGVGPFMLAMADVKTLNKIKELFLQNLALSVFGVYTVINNGTFNPNTAVIRPGMFIPVERNGGTMGPSIAPLPTSGNFEMQEFVMNSLEDHIKKIMLDTRLPEDRPQPRTAFEIAERIKEFQADIGSAYGRAIFEFVIPLFRRIIEILAKKKLIALPPGFDIDQFMVKIQVVSPIAQTQAMADVQRFLENYQMTANISPQIAMMSYDIEKLPQWLIENVGGPAELLRSQDDKTLLTQAIAQSLAMMQAQGQQPAPMEGAANQGTAGAMP